MAEFFKKTPKNHLGAIFKKFNGLMVQWYKGFNGCLIV